MTAASSESLGKGLSYEGRLPLAWSEIQLPRDVQLRDLEHANMDVLRTLFALEAYSGEISDELPEAESQHVVRLDFKLNLLLDMVGHLLARQQSIPEARLITLTSNAICWLDSTAPTEGSLLRIELYCSTRYPRPLILHGHVKELTSQADRWLVQAEFQNLSEAVREGLERFIFVQHRRAISNSKRSRQSNL